MNEDKRCFKGIRCGLCYHSVISLGCIKEPRGNLQPIFRMAVWLSQPERALSLSLDNKYINEWEKQGQISQGNKVLSGDQDGEKLQ